MKSDDFMMASRLMRDEDKDEDFNISCSADEVMWDYSPTQVLLEMSPDYEREVFESQEPDGRMVNLLNHVLEIASVVDSSSKAIKDLKIYHDVESGRVTKALSKQLMILKNLSVQLGRRSENSDFVTLWGPTDVLSDRLNDLAKRMGNLDLVYELEHLAKSVKALSTKVFVEDSLQAINKSLSTFVDKSIDDCKRFFVQDMQSTQYHQVAVEQFIVDTSSVIGGLPLRMNVGDGNVEQLTRLVMSLQKEMASLRSTNGAPRVQFANTSPVTAPASAIGNSALENQVNELSQKVQDLILGKDEMVVSFGSFSFRSREDTFAWLKTHHAKAEWDHFYDPTIILRRLCDSGGDMESLFKNQNHQRSAGIKNDDEASAIIALQQEAPKVFHKGPLIITRQLDASPFNQMKKHRDWHLGVNGLKPHLTRKLAPLVSAWQNSIHREFSGCPAMLAVCTLMLTESHAFLLALFDFVDAEFSELTTTSKFGVEQSWGLNLGLLKRILSDLHLPKNGLASQLSLKDREGTCATVMWGALLTLRHVRRFMKDGISHHPSISSKYVAFLALRSGSEKLDTTTEMVEAINGRLKVVEKDLSATKAKADTATQKVQDLSKSFAKFQQAKNNKKQNE